MLDVKEIEKKLRESKAEREKLLKERVSLLPAVGNRIWILNQPRHTALDMAASSPTPTQLPQDGPKTDVWNACLQCC